MFNPLPFLALSAVALGYSGAIDRVDSSFQTDPAPTVSSFAAASNLSVQTFAGSLPQSVQDPYCDAKDVIVEDLSHDFAETFEASLEQDQTVSLEVWASDLMGTWTVLHVEKDGLTCIVSSGFGWTDGMSAEDVLQDRPLS